MPKLIDGALGRPRVARRPNSIKTSRFSAWLYRNRLTSIQFADSFKPDYDLHWVTVNGWRSEQHKISKLWRVVIKAKYPTCPI